MHVYIHDQACIYKDHKFFDYVKLINFENGYKQL